MSAKVITFGISKGGCSKSTSSGTTAWILAQQGERVLCVDMDSQGNLTSMLTGEYDICNVFEERTTLEAIINKDVRPYIINVDKNLDLVPSNDYLTNLLREMMKHQVGATGLSDALSHVLDDYDYIFIDTPPNLGEQTTSSLSVSSPGGSYAVIMFDGSMFCYYAVEKFLEIMSEAKKRVNPELKPLGVLFAIIDGRVKEHDTMEELIEEDYPNLKFDTVIRRKAATRRIPIYGFGEDNRELSNALEHYYPFVEELKQRVEQAERPKK